jgi:hypothetical protein
MEKFRLHHASSFKQRQHIFLAGYARHLPSVTPVKGIVREAGCGLRVAATLRLENSGHGESEAPERRTQKSTIFL